MKLQADLHTHTIASTHAYSTLMENCQWAEKHGLKAIAMTDHTFTLPDSPHEWHFENMKSLPRVISNVIVLRGAEVNIINENGELDINSYLENKLEWVVASMHSCTFKPTNSDNHTKSYLAVAENPIVDVIGHCTTSLFPFDMEQCVKKFREYEKYIEINESSIISNKSSRENTLELLRLCKKYEAQVVVNSDGHFCSLIGQTPIAFEIIESINFPEKLVANSNWNIIREHIIKKHKNIEI